MKKRGKTFYKYLFSYLCIGLIPMLLNSIISYSLLLKYSSNQESILKAAQIDHIEELIQQQISMLNTISIEISTEKCFSNINPDNLDNFYDITEFLSEKKAMNNFIFDIFYVDLENLIVYTTNSIYQKDDFENNLYHYNHGSLLESIKNTTTGKLYFLPLSNVSRYGQAYQFITLTIPTNYIYSLDGQKTSGIIVFLIQKETLETLIGTTLQSENSINLLYYQDMLLYCSESDFNKTLPPVSSLIETPDISINNISYKIYYSNNPLDSISLIELVPFNHLDILSNVFFPSFAIVSLITIGICCIFIFLFMRVNYRPLRLLSMQIFGRTNDRKESLPSSDDLETIQNAMHMMYTKQNELIEHNHFLLKEQCFYRLLDNRILLHDDIKKQFFLAGLPLDGPFYFLALFVNQENVLNLLIKHFSDIPQIYWNNTVIPKQVILLASGPKNAINNYKQIISSWNCDKGIGSVCDSFSELHNSYLKAQKNYYSCTGSDISIPLSEIRSACRAIESGDYPRFVFLLHSISDNPVLFQSTDISTMTYSLIIGGIFSSLRNQKDPNLQNFLKLESKYFTPPGEPEKASQMIASFADEIYNSMQSTNNCRLTLQTLLDYIANNCFDIMFSIKGMANYFQTTPSNLSHFFKKKTNLSLSKYIQSLKISRAKELILSTDMPIKEIINIIGYTDLSSFIRLFKAETGMTPNEFRYTDFSAVSSMSVITVSKNYNNQPEDNE